MSFPLALTPPIFGATAFRLYPGFGILGADIPSDGDNGGSPVLNDSPSPTAEYHWRVETPPSAGALTIYPDLTFEWDSAGLGDGAYPWAYRLFETGSDQGTATVQQLVGGSAGQFAVALEAAVFVGGAMTSPRAEFALTTDAIIVSGAAQSGALAAFAATMGDLTFSGGAHVSPRASFDAPLAESVFVGGTSVSPSASFSLTTGEVIFAGGAYIVGSSPVASFSATLAGATFSGGALTSPIGAYSAPLAEVVFVGGAHAVSVGGFNANLDATSFVGGATVEIPSEGAYALVFDSVSFSGGATGYVPSGDVTLNPATLAAIADIVHAKFVAEGYASDIAAAVIAALRAASPAVPVDVQTMNGAEVIGDGSEADPWRGAGVSP